MNRISYSFISGRLFCGQTRNWLNKLKLTREGFDYIESSGLIEREFTVIGKEQDVQEVTRTVQREMQRSD